jgi:hypothetical protein
MRIARALVAIVALVAIAPLAPPADAGAPDLVETFDSVRWYERWGLADAPWHTTRRTSPLDGTYLRVTFAPGEFNGSSWALPTGTADDVTLSYRVRFGTTWRPMLAQTGKLPGFGLPRRTSTGRCAEACDLKPVTGPHYSARASFNHANVPGSYLYTPECGTEERRTGRNDVWTGAPPLLNDVWYTVRQRIVMNTPGRADGRIQAWIDGTLVHDSGPAHCFRAADHPEVHVGTVWMEMYYGGRIPPLLPMWLDLDDVQVSY